MKLGHLLTSSRGMLLPLLIIFRIQAQSTPAPSPPDSLTFRVFLIGDVGRPLLDPLEPSLQTLQTQLQEAPENSAVIFLGDNIYPYGMPARSDANRDTYENYLKAQLDVTKGFAGQVFLIPGNHDWAQGRRWGWQYLRNQERFAESYLPERGNFFLPDDGCPGPVEIPLSDELVLLILDTQWWLHRWEKPGEDSDCEAKDEAGFIGLVEEAITRNHDKKIIVASHHPMYTYGPHGGLYRLRQHLFPLTDVNSKLWIPLPFIGSLYPLQRKYAGNIQDTPHPRYRALVRSLTRLFDEHPNLIHVAGHEHTQQYIVRDSVHYVVSGAGCKSSPVRQGKGSQFASSERGFASLDFHYGGDVWLNFWEPGPASAEERSVQADRVFHKKLMTAPYAWNQVTQAYTDSLDLADSTVIVNASDQYQRGALGRFFFGNNYRDVWKQPIKVPVFDIGKEAGGLTITKRGGGQQTKSLRLENKEGAEYVLRSIEKFPEGALPKALRGTLAANAVQDQISAAHPYGALVVPYLADAAGIFHTNPKLVYLPDDPRLGMYQRSFANTLALFEERPNEAHHLASLGDAEDYESTDDVLEHLREDNDDRTDQPLTLRSRLFDILIGDWDRHDDQWRWAEYEEEGKKGKLYRPVPRDRDQVFFINEGLAPKIMSRKWAMPKIQGFGEEIRDVVGFSYNARFFDRTFLNEMTLDDWLAQADSLQRRLTDDTLAYAIRQWPSDVFRLRGEEVIRKLQRRRDDLKTYAREYYLALAQVVDIVGSNKHETFLIDRLDDARTRVTVYKTKKDGEREQVIYERTFYTDETQEIRLYGLDGEDQFQVRGDVNRGILLRIVGGSGEDRIVDESKVLGPDRKTLIYDTEQGNDIAFGTEGRDFTSNDPDVNDYNRKAFLYDKTTPLLDLGYNADEGFHLSAGVQIQQQGFRKEPYAIRHYLLGAYATRLRASRFYYQGDFTNVFGRIGLRVTTDVRAPRYVNNFFGLGNETFAYDRDTLSLARYRLPFRQVEASVLFKGQSGNYLEWVAGPYGQYFQLTESAPTFPSAEQGSIDTTDLTAARLYGGLAAGVHYDSRNDRMMPTAGFRWNLDGHWVAGLNAVSHRFAQFTGDFAFYWGFRLPARITLASRVGGGVTYGPYEFFQALRLGGTTNLRGYRLTRFAGRRMFYNNTELRVRLFSFRTNYVGLIGYHDIGRVWIDGEDSHQWHRGYGGGLWVAPFRKFVLSATYGFSAEERLPLIQLGYFF
ncbi:Calcineurin-like phosphoesterase [Catalinimonas alkaloidigena]|uniref:Calcineurin-like phosphoesterase n=1 Tax=Catalinimonas alkaloidigena TaxID=1075417 RepID=A0A1G8WNE6_9BACT|nr:BamA/TamA family outer membrane protein [Catalinimonas alkaloidigena]SDJ79160.1 Calcineurin-like phosphoesterase [Catalinimonas alkaloidigena]